MEEVNQQQEQSMSYAGIIGSVGAAGASIGLWNNAYRMGRMGSIRGGVNTELVKRMVEGKKVAGNFKMPFTDLVSRPFMKGKTESKAGFGYFFQEESKLGIKEGQGFGYNFSYNKEVLRDLENGTIDKELLHKNFQERFTKSGTEKMTKKNMKKSELSDLLNDSLSEDAKIKYSIEKNEIKYSASKNEKSILIDEFSERIKYANQLNKKTKIGENEIKKIISETMFETKGINANNIELNSKTSKKLMEALNKKGLEFEQKDVDKIMYEVGQNFNKKFKRSIANKSVAEDFVKHGKTNELKITKEMSNKIIGEHLYELDGTVKKEAYKNISKAFKQEGIKISEKEAEKIAAKKVANIAEKTLIKKASKYAALTPLLAVPGFGEVAMGVIGGAFLAYDLITIPKAINEGINAYYDGKKSEQAILSSKDRSRNVELAGNQVSIGAANRSYTQIQQASFNLNNLIRNGNMASNFLNTAGWR